MAELDCNQDLILPLQASDINIKKIIFIRN